MPKKLSETQLLLLNNLIYRDEFTKEWYKGYTVETVLKDIVATEGGNSTQQTLTPDEWDEIYAMALNDPDILNLRIADSNREDSTGAKMACFVDSDGQAYAVFAGTGANEWRDDCVAANMTDSPQQIKAKEWLESLPYDDIIVSGHSKGANKSMYVTITTDKVKECYAFDGEGVSIEFCEKYAKQISKVKNKIHLRSNYRDFVNALLVCVAGDIKFIVNDGGVANAAEYHAPNSLFMYDKNGNIIYSIGDGDSTTQDSAMEMLHNFTVYIMENATEAEQQIAFSVLGEILTKYLGGEDGAPRTDIIETYGVEAGEIIIRYLTQYLQDLKISDPDTYERYKKGFSEYIGAAKDGGFWGLLLKGAKVLGIPDSIFDDIASGKVERKYRRVESFTGGNINGRDFSETARTKLINAVKETEEEAWWRVDRWDCWYKVENFFGHLKLDNYTANADAYYRKLVDINDASVQDIENIFNKVKTIDDTYGSSMRQSANNLSTNVLNRLKQIENTFNI